MTNRKLFIKNTVLIGKILVSLFTAVFVFISPYAVLPYGLFGFFSNRVMYAVMAFVVTFVSLTFGKGIFTAIFKFLSAINRLISVKIGVEIIVFNILSLVVALLVYNYSFRMSGYSMIAWNIPIAAFWALVSFLVMQVIFPIRKTRYIKEIADGIVEISKGNLDFKLAVKGHDELKILAESINRMSSELKNKIEEERRSEQTKNELITNVSHDLKTPLTTVIGYLTLIKDKNYENADILNNYVEKAHLKSLKLKKLIEDLFEYTKLSNGVIRVNKTRVNIVELLKQQIGEISVLAQQNNLSFEKHFARPEIMVEIDSELMARVFENILSNAIKYSYKELPEKIFVSVSEERGNAVVMIENQGDTIPTEVLPLLFERFYRGDQSRNSKIAGSGLGLAIAKSVVELHDGKIYAESHANIIRIYVILKAAVNMESSRALEI